VKVDGCDKDDDGFEGWEMRRRREWIYKGKNNITVRNIYVWTSPGNKSPYWTYLPHWAQLFSDSNPFQLCDASELGDDDGSGGLGSVEKSR